VKSSEKESFQCGREGLLEKEKIENGRETEKGEKQCWEKFFIKEGEKLLELKNCTFHPRKIWAKADAALTRKFGGKRHGLE